MAGADAQLYVQADAGCVSSLALAARPARLNMALDLLEMSLPTPTRKVDVTSKLAYADKRRNALMDELFAAKKEDRDPDFLIHAAADVISNARECFDYVAQDIIESYVLPNDKKAAKAYAEGSLKVYFPFHEPQLTNPKAVLHSLKTRAPRLYADLMAFTKACATGKSIASTLFNCADFLSMKDMVNEKKHDKLLAVVSDKDQELLIEGKGFSAIIPLKEQKGWHTLTVTPGSTMTHVAEYRFAFNSKEVSTFCLFAVKATERIVLNNIYARNFA
ncbi:MAG: hypothetical protein ACSLFJ_15450 [Immundisolibacter sp.]|uniref:hypothetical protein n=1 Tax=Immundisolibacter sp. TaxID=1934948 RepID=UPI003EDFD21C